MLRDDDRPVGRPGSNPPVYACNPPVDRRELAAQKLRELLVLDVGHVGKLAHVYRIRRSCSRCLRGDTWGWIWTRVSRAQPGRYNRRRDGMQMTLYDFKVILKPDDTGGYVVSCPSLPGCYSQGETVDEALANIKEAIELCLEDM